MKIMKIDVCNFENTLFDDKSIIVDCTLNFKDEYKIKAMIDNKCIDYSFIDIDIVHKVCELLRIKFLQLNKSREVKNYDEKRNKDIIHAIYSFITILNHTKSCISIMIIKFDQHSLILEKFSIKKHDVSHHDHDDSISLYFDYFSHFEASKRLFSNQSTKKKDFFSKRIFFDQSKIIENKEIKFFFEKTNNSKIILKRTTSIKFSKRLNERSERLIERRMNES
jgi:hypothetical protein